MSNLETFSPTTGSRQWSSTLASQPDFSGYTFCTITYGCQMNQSDSEQIAGMLTQLHARRVFNLKEADIAVFMTCCVREKADERLLGQVATIKNLPVRDNAPVAKRCIAIGGCMAQRDGSKLLDELDDVEVVFGTHNMDSLPHLLSSALSSGAPCANVIHEGKDFPSSLPEVREVPWAAWLPISVGCNNFCTYCIVPYVRGHEISRPLSDIVQRARYYVSDGVKEITLLGQNVNSYGTDIYGEPRFDEVLEQVSATGVERLRFVTSNPKDLTDSVISKFGTLQNLMPALHLPVQSGSNRILQAMRRKYTYDSYMKLVAKLRQACPNIGLSTDIIVGFPGETEEDFEQTLHLVQEVGYQQVFTFIYSPREGTPAAQMKDDTPKELIHERFTRLTNLVQKEAFKANQVDEGSDVDVLVEDISKRDPHMFAGKSPKNQTVHAPIPQGISMNDLRGNIIPVHIDTAKTWYLTGHIIDKKFDPANLVRYTDIHHFDIND